jgi:hypothetical protein
MEGFSFVTPVTGVSRPNTGKEEEDDDAFAFSTHMRFLDQVLQAVCLFPLSLVKQPSSFLLNPLKPKLV